MSKMERSKVVINSKCGFKFLLCVFACQAIGAFPLSAQADFLESASNEELYIFFLEQGYIGAEDYNKVRGRQAFATEYLVERLWSYAQFHDPDQRKHTVAAALDRGYYDALEYLAELIEVQNSVEKSRNIEFVHPLVMEYTDFKIVEDGLPKWIELNPGKIRFDYKRGKFTTKPVEVSYRDIAFLPLDSRPSKISLTEAINVKVSLPGGAGSAQMKKAAGAEVELEKVVDGLAYISGSVPFTVSLEKTDILERIQRQQPRRLVAKKEWGKEVAERMKTVRTATLPDIPAVIQPTGGKPGAVSGHLDNEIPFQYYSNGELDGGDLKRVHRKIESLFKNRDIHYVAVAAMDSNTGFYVEIVYGWESLLKKKSVVTGSVVPYGKLSRLVTASLIQDYILAGTFEGDQDFVELMGDRLKGYDENDKRNSPYKKLSVWELLSQKYRITDQFFWDRLYDQPDGIHDSLDILEQAFQQRTKKGWLGYCSPQASYIVLGELIAKYSGQNYLDSATRIFPGVTAVWEEEVAGRMGNELIEYTRLPLKYLVAEAGLAGTLQDFMEFSKDRDYRGKHLKQGDRAGKRGWRYSCFYYWNAALHYFGNGVNCVLLASSRNGYILNDEYEDIFEALMNVCEDTDRKSRR